MKRGLLGAKKTGGVGLWVTGAEAVDWVQRSFGCTATGVRVYTWALRDADWMSPRRRASRTSSSVFASSRDRYEFGDVHGFHGQRAVGRGQGVMPPLDVLGGQR